MECNPTKEANVWRVYLKVEKEADSDNTRECDLETRKVSKKTQTK